MDGGHLRPPPKPSQRTRGIGSAEGQTACLQSLVSDCAISLDSRQMSVFTVRLGSGYVKLCGP